MSEGVNSGHLRFLSSSPAPTSQIPLLSDVAHPFASLTGKWIIAAHSEPQSSTGTERKLPLHDLAGNQQYRCMIYLGSATI